MLSSTEVPTLLFQIRFAWFKRHDFPHTRLLVDLRRVLPGRAPSATFQRLTIALRMVPVERRL